MHNVSALDYEAMKTGILNSLGSAKCDICKGTGHIVPQCGTFKALDKAMSNLESVKEIWFKEKQGKVNTKYHELKETRREAVSNKLLGVKRRIEGQLEVLGLKKVLKKVVNNNNNDENEDWIQKD